MRTQGRPVDDQRGFRVIFLVGKFQFEPPALGKINLVGGQRKFPADGAPYLHINLGSVKCRFVRYFHKRSIGF